MTERRDNIERVLREFLSKRFFDPKDVDLYSGDESLLDSGLIDSVAIFDVVSFLEQQFGIQVSDEDVVPDHFETLNKLTAYVQTKSVS